MREKTLGLLAPRPNPEIPVLLQIIQDSAHALLAEDDYVRRLGRSAVLIAHLKSLMDEPETISWAALPGLVNDDGCWFTAAEMPEVDRFLSERPFDKAGPSSELHFFYTDTGKFSPLYSAPALDPYHVGVLWSYGHFVHTMEKLYATESPTSMHVQCAAGCVELLRAEGFHPADSRERRFVLFIDPRGCSSPRGSSGLMVARFEDQATAEKAADFLSTCLHVRFLVAIARYTLCTH
ncbi:hypothetical protein JXA88_16215 [Candidatus Fermentibacteria bacterium]|nr:hypothetical protein [Candidatus Fermentibacteria bacterium]